MSVQFWNTFLLTACCILFVGTKQVKPEPSETSKAGLESPPAAQQRVAAADDSDDDEIFGGAGKDFEDPVAAAAKALEQQNGTAAANGQHTGAALFGSDARLADLPPGSTKGARLRWPARPGILERRMMISRWMLMQLHTCLLVAGAMRRAFGARLMLAAFAGGR